ncbi:MAG TPA: phytanoyl-CoA dioxygenase family protein [Polyangiaceae bacterium]|nr:phytanoyl-CoA dioxygenase family protein [Polyangiaceae bacterium]
MLTKDRPDSLSTSQRETIVAEIEADGFAVLPMQLPAARCQALCEVIESLAADERERLAEDVPVKLNNCVDRHPALRELALYRPALELSHDVLGPMFHLAQSNCMSRPPNVGNENDFLSSSPWHADGPRPRMFPAVGGRAGLHYLKFAFFLSDVTGQDGGALEVVRGSHKRQELDGLGSKFRIEPFEQDVVEFRVPAGTVVAFHQALWHAARPNRSSVRRTNVYISYCPTWMRPIDRDFPAAESLEGLDPTTRWLLGEPRPAMRWWLPNDDDLCRLSEYARS